MQIEMSKEQYKKLVKMVYLGEWMINSIRVEDFQTEYEDVASLIYSYGSEAGIESLFDKGEDGKYYPGVDFDDEEDTNRFRELYDETTFWEDLMFKLVDKDMLAKYGSEKFTEMSIEEKIDKEAEFFEMRDQELVDNGLENFKID